MEMNFNVSQVGHFSINKDIFLYIHKHKKKTEAWSCSLVDHRADKGSLMHKNTKNFEEEMKDSLDVNRVNFVSRLQVAGLNQQWD